MRELGGRERAGSRLVLHNLRKCMEERGVRVHILLR